MKSVSTIIASAYVLIVCGLGYGAEPKQENGASISAHAIDELLAKPDPEWIAFIQKTAGLLKESENNDRMYMIAWCEFIEKQGLVINRTKATEIDSFQSETSKRFARTENSETSTVSVNLGRTSLIRMDGSFPKPWFVDAFGPIAKLERHEWKLEMAFDKKTGLLQEWGLKFGAK